MAVRSVTSHCCQRMLIATAILVAAIGCTPSTPKRPSGTAPGTPPSVGFPDLSSYTTADPRSYYSDGPDSDPEYRFTTPIGQRCRIRVPKSYAPSIGCAGPIPGRDGEWNMGFDTGYAVGGQSTSRAYPDEPAQPTAPTLPLHYVLRLDNGKVQCGITDNGTAACLAHHGGFLAGTGKLTFF